MDIFGKAVLDYQNGSYTEDIKTYSSLDEEDFIPIPYLFRAFKEMPVLEQKALELCKGHVLDIGCGAGSHSLYLQEKGLRTTALDSSKGAIETCKLRGIKETICTSIMDYKGQRFDTLLLLMNGIGVAGQLSLLDAFLAHMKSLLNPKGQILLDTSDIIYMFDVDEVSPDSYWNRVQGSGRYYGEVTFTISYKGEKSEPFSWLYLDFDTLQNTAKRNNFNCEPVKEGKHYDFLVKLTLD